MFCRNCGAEMSENARFCPKCGNARLGNSMPQKKIVEDNCIKFTLNPEYNVLYEFLNSLWNGILIIFLVAYFITGYEILYNYPIFPVIFLVIYIIVKMTFRNIQYKNLKYNFYATKIEYIDGFFYKEEKELKYKYVREVTMNRTILERICGIGTIRIYTNASSNINGLKIQCLKDVEKQYRIIKQSIDEGTQE